MAAYIVGSIEVHDPEGYKEYIAQVPAFVKKHGGEYLVRGGAVTPTDGGWKPQRVVLLKFPSVQAAKDFVADPAYAPVAAIRHRTAKSQLVIVEGV